MKLNWGTGIIIVILLFVAFIVTLVVKTYSFKVDLVADDYYQQELDYQNRINSLQNALDAPEKITWQLNDKNILIQFPKIDSISGTIELFRSSDSDKDRKKIIQLDSNYTCSVPINILSQGAYLLKVNWSTLDKNYFTEESIYIP